LEGIVQIKNQLIPAYRIILVVLLLGILSSAFDAGNISIITAGEPLGLPQDVNLDEDASQWGVFPEVPNQDTPPPTWELNNVSSPSLDGRSLRCALTGGHPYSNIHCYRNLTADPASNVFTLSMSFYYQPASTFNNIGGPSVVQALEFTMNKWHQGLRYEWALQWDNVDTGAPKWRYWGRKTLGGPLDWFDLGIAGSLAGKKWHNLKLEGEILAGQVHYKRFIIDGQKHPLELMVSPDPTNELDKLAVAVQLDGNSTETPYEVILDQVTFEHLNVPPGSSTLVTPNGAITDNTPTYTWNKVSTSTWYYLWVNNAAGTPVIQQWYAASQVCVSSTCSVTPGVPLPLGNYRWWIQTWNDGGYGPWSNPKSFSVKSISPPGTAILVSPTGNITDITPTYKWNKVNTSTWYYLWVSRVNMDGTLTTIHNKWYDSPTACSARSCSVIPAGVSVTSGNYTWWIQTWNDGGYGLWSSHTDFRLP
jgi:hypothetical protein